MMTFENRVWMGNDFGGPILWIFYFQKHPPIWGMCRVKKFFKKMNFYIENPSDILLCLSNPLCMKIDEFRKSRKGGKPMWDQKFWIFHSQKHPPFTLKWWAKNFFQKDEFLYGVPHQTLCLWCQWCERVSVWTTFSKNFVTPLNPFFGSKGVFFCNFGPWPIYWARRYFRFWGDQVLNILSFCLTNCIPINRNLLSCTTYQIPHTFFIRTFFHKKFFYKNFFIRTFFYKKSFYKNFSLRNQ